MSDSSSSRAPKKRFAIPSIDDIDKFEHSRPKIPSNFKSKNVATSSGASGSDSGALSFQSASSLLASSSSGHESDSRLKSSATAGPSRTSNPGRKDGTSRGAGQSAMANQTAVSNEKAEAMRSNLELRRQKADEALRERLEAGANALAASSTTAGNLQRPRPQVPVSGRSDAGAGSSSAGPSLGGRGVNPGYQNRPPQGGGRGKIGSSFANKFYMLGTADEYKIPQAAVKPPTSDSSGAGTSTNVNKAQTGNSIIVNPRQRGNPILKHIRNVPWEFGDIVPDYVMGRTTCAFYLSLRYHNLNPNYINERLTELGHKFELRVLLVQVDVKDPHHSVKELARLAILTDCTLMLAWNAEEAGRYLETYKAYENKPADALKERIEENHLSKMTNCLTTVKSVNKTDVITLLGNCGTFEKIVQSSKEELALLPGFGPQKAKRLSNIFTEPFLRRFKRRPVQTEEEKEEGAG